MQNIIGIESQVWELSIEQIKVESIQHLLHVLKVYFQPSHRVILGKVNKILHFSAQILLMDSYLTWRKKKSQVFTMPCKFLSDIPSVSQLTLFSLPLTPYSSSYYPYNLIQHQGFYNRCVLCWECSFLGYLHRFSLPFENLCSNVTFQRELFWPPNLEGSPYPPMYSLNFLPFSFFPQNLTASKILMYIFYLSHLLMVSQLSKEMSSTRTATILSSSFLYSPHS